MYLDNPEKNYHPEESGAYPSTAEATRNQVKTIVSFEVEGGVPAFYATLINRKSGVEVTEVEELISEDNNYIIHARGTVEDVREAIEGMGNVNIIHSYEEKPTAQVA